MGAYMGPGCGVGCDWGNRRSGLGPALPGLVVQAVGVRPLSGYQMS